MTEKGIDKPTENWTKFPNCILDNLDKYEPMELKILAFMIRKNFGYTNPNKKFAMTYLMQKLNIKSKPTVVKSIRGLINKGSIKVTGQSGQVYQYDVNWVDKPICDCGLKNKPLAVQKLNPLKENRVKETISNSVELHTDKQKSDYMSKDEIDKELIEILPKKGKKSLEIGKTIKSIEDIIIQKRIAAKKPPLEGNKKLSPPAMVIINQLIELSNNTITTGLVLSKKDMGPLLGIIKLQTWARIEAAFKQAKIEGYKNKIKYSFKSIIYNASNIERLSGAYTATKAQNSIKKVESKSTRNEFHKKIINETQERRRELLKIRDDYYMTIIRLPLAQRQELLKVKEKELIKNRS